LRDSAELPVIELGRPGPERDQGIAAILAGKKTALTGLLEILSHEDEPVPEPGQRFTVVDSDGRPAVVIEMTEVGVVPVNSVGDDYAHAEGRGYADAAQWRAAHEELFTSPEVSAYLGFTPEMSDDTLVVTERFRVVRAAGDEDGSGAAASPARLFTAAAARAARYRVTVSDAPVFPGTEALRDLRSRLGTLRDEPSSPEEAVTELADAVEPALVASAGPRYFGFVIGGSLDSATAADMLAAGWDQNAFNTLTSPAAAVAEEVAGEWLKDLLGLPPDASFAFTTGGQASQTVCLAAARYQVLAAAGWDAERDGLTGAPRIRVVAGAARHVTIDRSLRLLGIGASAVEPVPADVSGAIDTRALARTLADGPDGPVIVCLQAGEVNTGAFDDFPAAIEAARRHGAWVHVDGAFGLWAAASPATRRLTAGAADADSWAADGHKWLNVPYDSGYAFCARPGAHKAAMTYTAAYLGEPSQTLRSPADWGLESSRRARGFATWAALRELGRDGVAALVERCCAHARRFAGRLGSAEGVRVVNDVVLNQVLVRFGDDDAVTDAVIRAVQDSGACWTGGTTWRGMRLLRISVSSWRTTEADVDRSAEAILTAARAVRAARA
jgi:glutamate/tyrosine decarboxylase-like PLP-dependent enzyme/uncharacterized protein YhfF